MIVLEIANSIINALKEKQQNVFFLKQWSDFRDLCQLPALSLFILEESPNEHKGMNYKQELSAHVEGFVDSINEDHIYHLIYDVKTTILKKDFPFTVIYQGYEITLPDEGANITSVRVKFQIFYLENMI